MNKGSGRRETAKRSPFALSWQDWQGILWRTGKEVGNDRLFATAAGVVFYGLLAIFPALSALVSMYGLAADAATVSDHLRALTDLIPAGAYRVVQDQIARSVSKSSGVLSLGFAFGVLLALWSANAGMKAVMDALNVAYGERESRGFFHLNLTALAFTIGTVLFILAAIGLVIVFPLLLQTMRLGPITGVVIAVARWPLMLLVMIGGVCLIYRFGPSREARPSWTNVIVGAVGAALLWLLGSFALSFYLSKFEDYDATYGALGAGVGLMMWIWMSAIVILLGAKLNSEIENVLHHG